MSATVLYSYDQQFVPTLVCEYVSFDVASDAPVAAELGLTLSTVHVVPVCLVPAEAASMFALTVGTSVVVPA